MNVEILLSLRSRTFSEDNAERSLKRSERRFEEAFKNVSDSRECIPDRFDMLFFWIDRSVKFLHWNAIVIFSRPVRVFSFQYKISNTFYITYLDCSSPDVELILDQILRTLHRASLLLLSYCDLCWCFWFLNGSKPMRYRKPRKKTVQDVIWIWNKYSVRNS